MTIGVPKEVKDHEARVGLLPSGVKALIDAGHKVLAQAGAGLGLRRVVEASSISSLSRLLSDAPWSAWKLSERWQRRFRERMAPLVEKEHARQAAELLRAPPHVVFDGRCVGHVDAILFEALGSCVNVEANRRSASCFDRFRDL